MFNSITPRNIATILVALALAVTIYLDLSSNPARNKGPGKSFGTILVDSPEIYTRERLVNDRFREDAWLKSTLENLRKLSEEKFGYQGIARTLKLDTKTMKLELHGSGQVSNSKGDSRQTGSQGGKSEGKHLGASDKFNSKNWGQGLISDYVRSAPW